MNVYCCLVCGKQFRGKGDHTEAYQHSLEPDSNPHKEAVQHNLFIGVSGANFGKVVCLPDDYEVFDKVVNDIKYYLDPRYTEQMLQTFDKEVMLGRSLEGTEFIPGLVGINNLKNTSFANVILQMLSCVKPIRDTFLLDATQ